MSKHRKHIRRWPKLAAASAALAAYIAGAVLPMTSATANNLPPAPTCDQTQCVWLMPDTAGAIDWIAPTNSAEIWIDIQSAAMPWAEPTHLHAQLRDPSHNLLVYFGSGAANVALGSLTFFRVNADPGDPWGYDSNYVSNVSFEPAESGSGAFVRIRQVIDPNAIAPQPTPTPTATPTTAPDPTPTTTMDALPAPTSSPEPVVTPTPEVAPTVNARPSVTPEATPSATVAPEVVVSVQPMPVTTSEPVATTEPVQTVESRDEMQDVAAVVPDWQPPAPPVPPAPPARPARVVGPAPEPATEPATEPETLTPTVQEPATAGVGVMPPKTESEIPVWAAAGVATAAATLASIGGVQLIRKRGARNLRKLSKLRVS